MAYKRDPQSYECLLEKWSQNEASWEPVDFAEALQEFLLELGGIVECPQGPSILFSPKQIALY